MSQLYHKHTWIAGHSLRVARIFTPQTYQIQFSIRVNVGER